MMGPGRRQKRGNRIFEEGERSPGTLTGIEVSSDGDTTIAWHFGFTVEPATGQPFAAGCRQTLPPDVGDGLRLGMPVEVRHDDDDCVLGWDPTGPGGWRPLKKPPEGIADVRLGKLKGQPTEATVLGWQQTIVMGMPSGNKDVRVELDGAERTLEKIIVPEWASHLLATGTTVPVHLEGRRPVVDWSGALDRHGPGVGVPTPPPS
jgi:hypothetical protein